MDHVDLSNLPLPRGTMCAHTCSVHVRLMQHIAASHHGLFFSWREPAGGTCSSCMEACTVHDAQSQYVPALSVVVRGLEQGADGGRAELSRRPKKKIINCMHSICRSQMIFARAHWIKGSNCLPGSSISPSPSIVGSGAFPGTGSHPGNPFPLRGCNCWRV